MIENTVGGCVPVPRKSGSLPSANRADGDDRTRAPLWEHLGWFLMLGLLIIGLPMAYQRAIEHGADLAGFCDAGRYVFEHGTRNPESNLARYWPSADVPWIVFALLPISVTAVLWYGIGCAAWIGLLRTIRGRMLVGLDPAAKRHATLAAGLMAMPLVIDGMSMGSFHVLMVWLMILGLDRACRGEEKVGGILLGLGAWLKLLPLLGIGFLFYHRKWKGALIAMATVFVLDVALCVVAFGPSGAWREHVLWWQLGAAGTMNRQLATVASGDEDRLSNESVAVILRRMLTSLGSQPAAKLATKFSAEIPAEKQEQLHNREVRRRVQLANLTPQQLQAVFLAMMAILVLGVAIYCRPVKSQDWAERGPAKIALLTLATIWFSPVVWSYHFVAATPVLAILLLRGRYRWQWVVPVIVVWGGALGLLAIDAIRAAGVLLWMSLILSAGLVVFPIEKDIEADLVPRKACHEC
ncbi:MAG: glycosyltransferase family 87 protein [Planctomycetota bacterium]